MILYIYMHNMETIILSACIFDEEMRLIGVRSYLVINPVISMFL